MDLKLKKKYALITGGSHGIGRNIALSLAKEGCNIAICARNKKRIDNVIKEIKKYNVDVKGYIADVMIKNDIEKTISDIINDWGTLHILVNNVGGGGRWGLKDIEKTKEEVWNDVYNKNVLSSVRFIIGFLPYMREEKWGRIIAISSIFGKEGGGRPWFNMAKSSQISMIKSLSLNKDLVRDGITFNTIAPGAIMIPDSGWEKEKNEDLLSFKKMVNELPFGRMGNPYEVANVVTFLCSELSSFVNGSCICVDGGQSKSF